MSKQTQPGEMCVCPRERFWVDIFEEDQSFQSGNQSTRLNKKEMGVKPRLAD